MLTYRARGESNSARRLLDSRFRGNDGGGKLAGMTRAGSGNDGVESGNDGVKIKNNNAIISSLRPLRLCVKFLVSTRPSHSPPSSAGNSHTSRS